MRCDRHDRSAVSPSAGSVVAVLRYRLVDAPDSMLRVGDADVHDKPLLFLCDTLPCLTEICGLQSQPCCRAGRKLLA